MLIRNSLLVSNKAIQLAIDAVAPGTPWEHVIRNGPTLAINSARRTVQLLIEAADSDMKPLLPSISVPLHALYILSVNIIRNPKSRMAKSDLNVSQQCQQSCSDLAFSSLLPNKQVRANILSSSYMTPPISPSSITSSLQQIANYTSFSTSSTCSSTKSCLRPRPTRRAS